MANPVEYSSDSSSIDSSIDESSLPDFRPVAYFSHITTWNNKVDILNYGLEPYNTFSSKYDGFLARLPWLYTGIWFSPRIYLQKRSCYPFGDDAEPFNPMLTFEAEKFSTIYDLAEYDWFELSDYPSVNDGRNIKIACLPSDHPARAKIGQRKIQNKETYEHFRCIDGEYYVPWGTFVSIFVVGNETLVLDPLLEPMWTEVEKIVCGGF